MFCMWKRIVSYTRIFLIVMIFQIVTVVNINMIIFWDVKTCDLVDRHRHFGGNWRHITLRSIR
jgi:hypothetical protein